MVNMGVTVGIGVTVVFLAWTSSKVLYVLKVMKKIVKKIYLSILIYTYQSLNTRIMRKILSDKIRMKLLIFSNDD
jgi:hypothetical protein